MGYSGFYKHAEQSGEPKEAFKTGREVLHLSEGSSMKPVAPWNHGVARSHLLGSSTHFYQDMTVPGSFQWAEAETQVSWDMYRGFLGFRPGLPPKPCSVS